MRKTLLQTHQERKQSDGQMRVLKIEELSKTRYKVISDNGFAFVLYKGELRHYGVSEGAELSRETEREIREELLPKRAKLRAMNLLSKRQYTGKQLYDKLIQGGYDEQTAEAALDYVRSFRYVDDAEYASEFIRCNADRRSRREIGQKLRQRGISAQIIAEAFDSMAELGFVCDEEERIRDLLQKKHFDPSRADEREKQRLYGFFYRKGFSMDLVRRLMGDTFT